jgi:HlyD family secretion protein
MTADLVGKLRRLSLDADRAVAVDAGESRWKRFLWVPPALALGAALFAGGYYAAAPSKTAPAPLAVPASAAKTSGAESYALAASGYVVAQRRTTVGAQVTGQIQTIFVQQGQQVVKGQLLARLDADSARASAVGARASAAAARSAITQLESEFSAMRENGERTESLYKRGFVSKRDLTAARASTASLAAQLERARANYESSRASRSGSEIALARYDIRAPFTGVVTDINAQAGEVISPISAGGGFTRTGICTIVDMASLEIEVDVAEAYISAVSPGQDVVIALDAYPDEKLAGKVIAIVPVADRAKASFRVRVSLDEANPRVLPEMAVKVMFRRPANASGRGGQAG